MILFCELFLIDLYFCLFFFYYYFLVPGASAISSEMAEKDVLKALSQIIDPDFGTDIVSCGNVKDMHINEDLGKVNQNMISNFLYV